MLDITGSPRLRLPFSLSRSRDNATLAATFAVVVVALLCNGWVTPQQAAARWLGGSWDRVRINPPQSTSTTRFSATMPCFNVEEPFGEKTYKLRGHKSNTVFRVTYQTPDGEYNWRRVTYSTFKRYASKWGSVGMAGDADWVWKTDSNGKRYRYAREMRASQHYE